MSSWLCKVHLEQKSRNLLSELLIHAILKAKDFVFPSLSYAVVNTLDKKSR